MKDNLYLILLAVSLLGIYIVGTLQSDYDNSSTLFSEKFLEQLSSVKLKQGREETVLSKSKEELQFGLEKPIHPNQWLISEPTLAAPNVESLNKLFSRLSQLKSVHQFESSSLAEFGLVNPQAALELSSNGGLKVLKLGSTNPVSKRRYVQMEGNKKVMLLDDGVIGNLLKLDLKDLKPLNIQSKSVERFSFEGRVAKSFVRKDGALSIDGDNNFDSQLIEQYVENILSLPAIRTVHLSSIYGPVQSKLVLNWSDSKGASNLTELELYSSQGENLFLKLPGAKIGYEYGPEFGRLLNRKLETFLNKKLLRSIILEDFFGSCPNLEIKGLEIKGLKIKGKCQPKREAIEGIQEIIRRAEVLDLERLPGRLMTPSKPECRLKLESSKVLFEILGKVNGDEAETVDSPRFFISDVGSDHYRGVISGLVAKDFCQAIDKLCSEVRASCAG